MTTSNPNRIDEVSKYYDLAVMFERLGTWLFWIIAFLSLCMLYAATFGTLVETILQAIFVLIVLGHFTLSQISRFYLIPNAERMRRKQMLSDAFGAPLSHDKTSLYYNNEYSPSIQRLSANTMENSLFSKEVASKMLSTKRLITGGYVALWLLAFSLRLNNLAILTWITQVVFSGEVVAQWLNLEVLRSRFEQVYEQLHSHFLYEIDANTSKTIATTLDSFVAYESAKSSAGILLSTKVFDQLNPALTEKWSQIRQELKMNT